MPIAPINYATIQRTADIENVKMQQDAKPAVDQQNIQVQVEHREDALRNQVLNPEKNDKPDNHMDAREEGKNKYKKQGTVKKKAKGEKGVSSNAFRGGFDVKI